MKYLVTGGAGFIGSNLCSRLLNDGHEVWCVDDFSTGRESNIAGLMPGSNFTALRHDITEVMCDAPQVDGIFHLACPASPVQYQSDPIRTMTTNVVGSLRVLQLAESLGVSVLLASTSEVYGDPERHPQTEDYWGNVNPVGPRACYDEGKRAAETLFADYRRRRGVDAKIVRIFNTYGPHMQRDDGRVVSNFIMQALQGDDITVYGGGEQTRSFCYVDDLIDGLILMMQSDIGGPINLGNPQEITVERLAIEVCDLVGASYIPSLQDLPTDDPRRRKPDIGSARRLLDWNPHWTLQDGLSRTISWFREEYMA